jgi:hypothetical protein
MGQKQFDVACGCPGGRLVENGKSKSINVIGIGPGAQEHFDSLHFRRSTIKCVMKSCSTTVIFEFQLRTCLNEHLAYSSRSTCVDSPHIVNIVEHVHAIFISMVQVGAIL